MNQDSSIKIIDVTNKSRYKKLLIGCIFHIKRSIPLKVVYQRHKERIAYLKSAIPKGYHMKVLFWKEDHVGMIEYGPPEASGLPITGKNIIVMNCIWVHTRAKGNNFGKLLMKDMMESEKDTAGFATIALEKYWMHWMQKGMMEKLGFSSIYSLKLKHKTYKKGQCFTVHLMWLPNMKNATPSTLDEPKLLYGADFCHHHPLYWGKYGCAKSGLRQIYEKC
jgi:hypothetical protein